MGLLDDAKSGVSKWFEEQVAKNKAFKAAGGMGKSNPAMTRSMGLLPATGLLEQEGDAAARADAVRKEYGPLGLRPGELLPFASAALAIDDARLAAAKGNYGQAAGSLVGVIPVAGAVGKVVRKITGGKSSGDIGGLLNIDSPQQADDIRVRQQNNEKIYERDGVKVGVWENSPWSPRPMSITDFVVDESMRGKGVGKKMLDDVLAKYDLSQVSAAASSAPSAALFYKKGFRPASNPNATLEQTIAQMKDDYSVTMVLPKVEPVKNQFEYPQQAALDTAQRNAALPFEQGGLGLPADNTPMDRARAMGFDIDNPLYHGTTNSFSEFRSGRPPVYLTDNPAISDIYAFADGRHKSLREINASPNVMPLVVRGKAAEVSDIGETGHGWYSDNLANMIGSENKRRLVNELPSYGYDYAKVNDFLDLGGEQTQYMIPSGSNIIRSRFAAFDPMRRNESDLLALNGQKTGSGLLNPEITKATNRGLYRTMLDDEEDKPSFPYGLIGK